jgi:hypothetical protein
MREIAILRPNSVRYEQRLPPERARLPMRNQWTRIQLAEVGRCRVAAKDLAVVLREAGMLGCALWCQLQRATLGKLLK